MIDNFFPQNINCIHYIYSLINKCWYLKKKQLHNNLMKQTIRTENNNFFIISHFLDYYFLFSLLLIGSEASEKTENSTTDQKSINRELYRKFINKIV